MQIRKKKSLLDQAGEYVDAVRPHVEQAAQTAKERAVPLLQEARDRAMPVIADGAALAADKASTLADVASAKAQEGAAVAAEKASTGRDIAAAKVAVVPLPTSVIASALSVPATVTRSGWPSPSGVIGIDARLIQAVGQLRTDGLK